MAHLMPQMNKMRMEMMPRMDKMRMEMMPQMDKMRMEMMPQMEKMRESMPEFRKMEMSSPEWHMLSPDRVYRLRSPRTRYKVAPNRAKVEAEKKAAIKADSLKKLKKD